MIAGGLVSGGSAIGGALVVTGGQARLARLERREVGLSDLARRLSSFAAGFDSLSSELTQLPRGSRRNQLVADWVGRRMPTVEYFFNVIARAVLGRHLYAALAEFQRCWNELVVTAPPEVLAACGEIAELLKGFGTRSDDYPERLAAAREDLAVVARLAAAGEFSLPLRRRLARRIRRRPSPLPASISKRLKAATAV